MYNYPKTKKALWNYWMFLTEAYDVAHGTQAILSGDMEKIRSTMELLYPSV